MTDREPLDAKPRTMKEICNYYGVSYRTMCKMMRAVGIRVCGKKKGSGMYYYQIGQLRQLERAFAQTELDFDV